MTAEAVRQVTERAAGRCEYCRMHQSLQGATFHIEHVVPRSAGGMNDPDNLALACPSCNLHKSDRVSAVDPADGATAPLFHPRKGGWEKHFVFEDETAVGLTAVGRATVEALRFNSPRRLLIRQAEARFGLFPPPLAGG